MKRQYFLLALLTIFSVQATWAAVSVQIDSTKNVTCYGGNDGAAYISPNGGTGPFSYNWSGPNGFSDTIQDITGLYAGSYSVTITDHGEEDNTDVFSLSITEPEEFYVYTTEHDESCFGANDAFVTVDSTHNGTAPFTYQWSNGATTKNLMNIHPDDGVYFSLQVTDANGCTAEAWADFYEHKQAITILLNITNASCRNADGAVSIDDVYNGVEPYHFIWSTGDTSNTGLSNIPAGRYFVQATDSNGCSNRVYFQIENQGAPTIDETLLKPCKGMSNGSISLDISGGTSPYVCLWSDSTTNTTKTGLSANEYSVLVTDLNGCISSKCISLEESDYAAYPNSNSSDVGSSNGKTYIQTEYLWGGNAPYTVKWSDGTTNDTLSNIPAGFYAFTVTDANGCTSENIATVSDNGGPGFTDLWNLQKNAHCGENDGVLAVSTNKNPITWYNQTGTVLSHDSILNGLAAGNYILEVSDENNAKTLYRYSVFGFYPKTQPICIVTVDSVTNKNIVVWDNIQTSGIDHYNIYKKTCQNQFSKIGTVDATEMSVFIDHLSTPGLKGYTYQITAVDECGYESERSEIHKTINLKIHVNEASQKASLEWDKYIGFPTSEYKIMRKDADAGWRVLTTVNPSTHSFTDLNYDWRVLGYCVAVERPGGACYASNRATGGPYYQSTSNLEDEGIANTTKIKTNLLSDVEIYPIPVKDQLNIKAKSNIKNVKIYNISGQLIAEYDKLSEQQVSLSTKTLDSGIYFIEIETNTLIRQKFIVE